ncbi:hypothetical protein WN943_003427 [Citrus x changshan-huyou]
MSHSWAMFIIRIDLDATPVLLEKNVLEGDKENGNTAGESINASNNVNVLNQENNTDDLEYDMSEDEFKFDYEDEWDAGLDGYESGDDSGPSLDDEDENVQAAACRYEANSGGFELTLDGGNIVLKIGQLFKIVAAFLHLFRGNTQLPIDVLGVELFRNYGIKCCNQRLYKAKNKALELLGQDHKASFTKLFRRRVMDERVESRSLFVIFGHNKSFEVMEDVSKRCVVDLGSKHCDCGEWAVSGLPCKHAICCINVMRYNVNEYVYPLLKKRKHS